MLVKHCKEITNSTQCFVPSGKGEGEMYAKEKQEFG